MRVFLVEDSEFIRKQFTFLFEGESYLSIVGHASSEDEAIEGIQSLKPDVVLVDLNLQAGSGMHVLSRARRSGFEGKLWVLSGRDPDFYESLCQRHGADGFYDKGHDQLRLLNDLRALQAELKAKGKAKG